jgi:hypothetical protein
MSCGCKGDKGTAELLAQRPKGFIGSTFMFVVFFILFLPILIPFVFYIIIKQKVTGKPFDLVKMFTNISNKFTKKDEDFDEVDFNNDEYEIVDTL